MIRHNGRTGRLFDVYRLNLTTGEITLENENPGDVFSTGFSLTATGGLRARFKSLPRRRGPWRFRTEMAAGGELFAAATATPCGS